MRYRKLDSNLDYVFGHGEQDFLVDSPQTVAQAVLTALRLTQGEWFLDTTAGVPWFTKIVGYGTRPTYDLAIKAAVLKVEHVKEILSYSSSLNTVTRKLTVEITIDTDFGTVVVPVEELSVEIVLGYGVGGYGEGGYGR